MAVSIPDHSPDFASWSPSFGVRAEERLDPRVFAGAIFFLDLLFNGAFATMFQSQTRNCLNLNAPLMTLDLFIAISLVRGQSQWINLARVRLIAGAVMLCAIYAVGADWSDALFLVATTAAELALLFGSPSRSRVLGSVAAFAVVTFVHFLGLMAGA